MLKNKKSETAKNKKTTFRCKSSKKSQRNTNTGFNSIKKIEIKQRKTIERSLMRIRDENDSKYLIEMGEANELSQRLNLKTTFRAFKSADGSIKCHQYEGKKFLKSLTTDDFNRELKSLKKQFFESRNLKIWDKSIKNTKDLLLQELQNKNDQGRSKKFKKSDMNIIRRERQIILKNCLNNTMNLTKTLKHQLDILQRKKINEIIIKEIK